MWPAERSGGRSRACYSGSRSSLDGCTLRLREAWLRTHQLDESSRETTVRVRKHIVPFFGHRPLSAITPSLIREWTPAWSASSRWRPVDGVRPSERDLTAASMTF